MNRIEQVYDECKATFGAASWPEYRVAGGKVAVSPDALRILVCTDGRYPSKEEGYQVNDRITETEELLWGSAVFELALPFQLVTATAGQALVLAPGRPYSVSGKCVSMVTLDQPWDSAQKRYVMATIDQAVQ